MITPRDLLTDPAFAGQEYLLMQAMAGIMAGDEASLEQPYAVQLHGLAGSGYRLGAGLRVVTGNAKGRQLYCMSTLGRPVGRRRPRRGHKEKFNGVKPGDEVHVDNRKFLAFCYFHRHHIMDDASSTGCGSAGRPIYPQHPVPLMSPLMGVSYTGHYEGKLLWVHHTHDSSLWPSQGIIYEAAARHAGRGRRAERVPAAVDRERRAHHARVAAVVAAAGEQHLAGRLHADHRAGAGRPGPLGGGGRGARRPRPTSTWTGRCGCRPTAAERGGVQPVVSVTANGGALATVAVGEPVTLEVQAEAPAAGGTIISVQWDFDGKGAFPFSDPAVDGSATSVTLTTTHAYSEPGTYFATALVASHRDGDVDAKHRRLQNLASARVVVR